MIGLAKGKMDIRILHKNEPSQGSSAFFGHAKDSATGHKVSTEA